MPEDVDIVHTFAMFRSVKADKHKPFSFALNKQNFSRTKKTGLKLGVDLLFDYLNSESHLQRDFQYFA